MIVKLAGVTQHQQMLVLVLLTDATAAETHYVMLVADIFNHEEWTLETVGCII